jgi:hypothetical protein
MRSVWAVSCRRPALQVAASRLHPAPACRCLQWLKAACLLAGSSLLLALAGGIVPLVRFAGEDITVTVQPGRVQVEGLYYYRNPWPFQVVQGVSVPFPVDTDHPPPIQVAITLDQRCRAQLRQGFLFGKQRLELRLGPGQTACLRVRYCQAAPICEARYILKTTRPWRRPIEHGTYRLIPVDARIVQSNYALTATREGFRQFQRTQFMPTEDWHFSWSVL